MNDSVAGLMNSVDTCDNEGYCVYFEMCLSVYECCHFCSGRNTRKISVRAGKYPHCICHLGSLRVSVIDCLFPLMIPVVCAAI